MPFVIKHVRGWVLSLGLAGWAGLGPANGQASESEFIPPPDAKPAARETVREALLHSQPDSTSQAALEGFRLKLENARRLRRDGVRAQAVTLLVELLQASADEDIQRSALLELALVAQDEGLFTRAQQILAQYASRWAQHPSITEVYLRQGELYRRMGATSLAIAKFYSVMTSALSLKVDQLEYYQKLVLQAQLEIAETHYLNGRWQEAAEFLNRLLKLDSPFLDRRTVEFKLIRAMAMQEQHDLTIAQAQPYIEKYPDASELPEVRFILIQALKRQGRTDEALQQVLLLLESQRSNERAQPEMWAYWQKRAGNEIGNELYREGDYLGTLQVYERLAEVDTSGAWQLPVWYQIGLVYERLHQPAKATEIYSKVLLRESEFTGTNATPTLQSVIGMARWRRDNLAWLEGANATASSMRHSVPNLLNAATDHEQTPGDR